MNYWNDSNFIQLPKTSKMYHEMRTPPGCPLLLNVDLCLQKDRTENTISSSHENV